jgi:hypothetical protein
VYRTEADLLNMDSAHRNIRPSFDHMSEVLTTDENGESVLRVKI